MEYAKDEVFSIKYKVEKDKLNYKSRFYNFIRRNKILTLLVSLGITFSLINFILIYNFIYLLNTI